jgi:hypothetical protein
VDDDAVQNPAVKRLRAFLGRRRWVEAGVALAAFAIALVGFQVIPPSSARQAQVAFDIDEAHKLAESFYFHLYFERGAWRAPEWIDDFYARTNPPVAKYVFGTALSIAATPIRDQALQRDFEELWRTPAQLRRRVPDRSLEVIRWTSGLYAAGVCALLAWIAARLGGPLSGAIAAALLLFNSSFRYVALRGLTDSIFLFHLLLLIPACWGATRAVARLAAQRGRSIAAAPVLLGLLAPAGVIALAAGSKPTGALAGPAYASMLLGSAWLWGEAHRTRRMAIAAYAVLGAGLLSLSLFVLMNPYFHAETLGRLLSTPAVLDDWLVKQQLDPGGGLFSLRERVAATGWMTLLSPAWIWTRGLGRVGHLLATGLLFAGIEDLLRRSLLSGEADIGPPDGPGGKGNASDCFVVLAWCVVLLIAITVTVPIARERYFLPCILAVILPLAIATGRARALVDAVWQFASRVGGSVRRATRLMAVVGLLSVCIAMAFWAADWTLVDPWRMGIPTGGNALEAYRAAVLAEPESPARHRRLAEVLLQRGDWHGAAGEFETALRLLPERGDTGADVLRATLLFQLSGARARSGERGLAREALNRHLDALRTLRDHMKSDDAFVRRELDRTLLSRTPRSR